MDSKPAARRGDRVIVPGERLGAFVLGRRVEDIVPPGPRAGIAEFSANQEVRVELEAGHLADASTGSGRYATAEGFRVGGRFADVIAAWGDPPVRQVVESGALFDFKAAWPQRGIDFLVKDDAVLHIGVFPPQSGD